MTPNPPPPLWEITMGYTRASMLAAVARKFVLLLPLIYIMPHITTDPATAVYYAEPFADVIAFLFTMILFATQFKKALRKIGGSNGSKQGE